jgi:Protein of unknown function (DUF1549)/Protein of unknown function (DUF1553)
MSLPLASWFPTTLACLLMGVIPTFGAKADKSTPVVTSVKPVTPLPMVSPANAIWHVWHDNQGHTVEAMFCGLSGEFITLQTRNGQTYHFNGNILSPEDIEFAKDCVQKMRASSFTQSNVTSAAADIDRIVESVLTAQGQKLNAPATDEQFMRRIYIDAIGRIPTAAEAQAFLSDRNPDRRAKLIDKLVYSPGYTMQMFDWMADLLRVKDAFAKGIPAFTFEDWLKMRLATNAPWDAMVKEMLTADGRLCDNGASGFLLFDAEMPLDGVANLMTTFLGTNMACAQCHDHPLAEWKQRDFYQMAAFFGATDEKDEKMIGMVRKAVAKDEGIPKNMVKKIADVNAFRLEDENRQKLTFPKDYKYKDAKPLSPVSPVLVTWNKTDAALPIYKVDTTKPAHLRSEFANWMTSPKNPRFATNIANRLWKKAFGLAVEEPVNDIDDLSKSSSPELLAHLTQIMVSARFDMREFQRVIYNSKTYQAAASPSPDLSKGPYLFNGPIVRRLSAEQVWDSLMVANVGAVVDNILLRRGEDIKQMALPKGAITAASVKQAYENMKAVGMTKGAIGKAGGSTAGLATGYEGEKPKNRFGMLLARASELPQPAAENHFLRVFGQGDRLLADSSTNDGSVPQVLMMMNGGIGKLVSDAQSSAIVAALAEKTREAQVNTLYLSYLSRHPRADEMAKVNKALSNGLGLTELAWVLANTREFLFVQ